MGRMPLAAGTPAFIFAGRGPRPAVLAELLGRPVVFHLLDRLADLGAAEVSVVCSAAAAGALAAVLGDSYRGMGIRRVCAERFPGTAVPLALALSRRPAAPALIVVDGGLLPTADAAGFFRWSADSDGAAALLLAETPAEAPHCVGRGRAVPAGGGRIAHFAAGSGGPGSVWTGTCLLRPAALAGVTSGAAASLERDVFPALAAAGALRGRTAPGRLFDLDVPEARIAAARFLAGTAGRPSCPAVFLDRDGTVIEERNYLADPAGVRLLPGAAEGLRRLQALGLPLVLATNQSGVGRGYFGRDAMERVHGRLIELLAERGVILRAVYSCPHAPEAGCSCRKPLPGLLLRAADELGLDLAASFAVGDKQSDIDCGLAAGAVPILVRTGYGAQEALRPDRASCLVAADLAEAAEDIAEVLRRRRTGAAQ